MNSSDAPNEFMAGAEVEVIGVGEDDLGVDVFKDILRDRLDGGRCAYWHEHGGLHCSMWQY